jgi:type I restriction enzyme S subunit
MKKIRLGDYIDLITDYHSNGSYKTLRDNVSLLNCDDYAIMIRTLNFEQNDFFDNLIYVNKKSFDYLNKSEVFPNDILMNKIANPGSVYLMPNLNRKVTCGMNLFLIRFNEKVNQSYMYYNMKYNENYIKGFSHGTTTKTITKDEVKSIELYVHDLPEQKKIAQYLGAITNTLYNNLLISRLLYSLNNEIFNYKVLNNTNCSKLHDNIFNYNFPNNWQVKKMSEIICLEKGISYKGEELSCNGIPMLNLANFDINRNYKNNELKFLKNNTKINKYCKKGDMLIACTDLTRNADIIGSPILINDEFENYTYSMDLCKIIIKSKEVNPTYLYMWLKTDFYHEYIKGFATGTNVMHLNTDGIMNYEIVLPPIELQNKIVKEIDANINKLNLLNKEEIILKNLYNEFLNLIMNGQIKVC